MEVRIFTFQVYSNGQLGDIPSGSGQVKFFETFADEGWQPLHWTDITVGDRVMYRVVMARSLKKDFPLTWGSVRT